MAFKKYLYSSASTHMRTGNASGLADSRVWNAGSGSGESSEHSKTTFREASLNVGSLKSRGSEVVGTMFRSRVDICALQEHRWAGGTESNQSRILKDKNSAYKFYWCGNKSGLGGAGFLLAEKWTHNVFEVHRVSNRILLLRLVLGQSVFTFVSVYAPQVSRQNEEKTIFYDELQKCISKVPSSEILIPLDDWNGRVGEKAGGFEDVHGGFGYGTRNSEGERILKFAMTNNLFVSSTCFMKRESHLVTYNSGGSKSQVDFILYRKTFKSMVKNVKVIPGEECALQHHLLVCDLVQKAKRKGMHFLLLHPAVIKYITWPGRWTVITVM